MTQEKTRGGLSGHTRADMSGDPRAAHTRSVLRQALLSLLEQGDWGGITVAGICRNAGVARSSFYEHYRTKSDLLDEIFAEMMVGISSSTAPNEPLATLDWLLNHVAEAPDFFAHAMEGGRGDTLLPRFRKALSNRLETELIARGTHDAHAKAAYVIGGSMAYLAATSSDASRAFVQNMAASLIGSTL